MRYRLAHGGSRRGFLHRPDDGEGGDTLCSLPFVVPAYEPLDWESLLEQAEARVKEERTRADVADLRCEELRRSERDACSRARSLERQLDTCRFKLKAAVAEAKDAAGAVSSTPKIGSRAAKALERRLRFLDDEVADLRVTLHRAPCSDRWDRGASRTARTSRGQSPWYRSRGSRCCCRFGRGRCRHTRSGDRRRERCVGH